MLGPLCGCVLFLRHKVLYLKGMASFLQLTDLSTFGAEARLLSKYAFFARMGVEDHLSAGW